MSTGLADSNTNTFRSAKIVLAHFPDGLELTLRRPRSLGLIAYEAAMWTPLFALVAVATWLFASDGRLVPQRTALIALIGLIPAGMLYCVVALMSRPGWAAVQRIRIQDDVLYKQYPFGQIDSLALPVQLDLSLYHTLTAVVERVKRDDKKAGVRPPLRNRVRIDCDYKPMLWLGPSLTLEEAQLVADHLNAHFDSMRANR